MSVLTRGEPLPQQLKLWQQNLDRSLDHQQELLNMVLKETYHFMALQEPYMGPGNVTRADSQWRVVYPTLHGTEGVKTRAVTLVNVLLPTDAWAQIHIPSADMVVVEFRGDFGTIRLVNIYNDGDHVETLKVLRDFMCDARRNPPQGGPVYYLWVGDFNWHSAL
jgi:hypothetical protein